MTTFPEGSGRAAKRLRASHIVPRTRHMELPKAGHMELPKAAID